MPPDPMAVETTHWVHDLDPFLIQFSESFGIRYYGLAYVMSFVLGGWLLHRAAVRGRLRIEPAAVMDLMNALVLGVVLGGRLGYFVLYEPATLFSNPIQLLKVWEGGMASHGGFVGVAIGMLWFARRHGQPFRHIADAVSAVAPLGLGLGRVANFIKGELWGRPSEVPWAVIFPDSVAPDTPLAFIAPRHPSQIYEAMLEGFLLFAFLQWRFWRTDVVRVRPGRLSGEFLLAYAVARIVCEIFREPDLGVSPILGLNRGMFYSFFFAVAGVGLVIFSRSSPAKDPTQSGQ